MKKIDLLNKLLIDQKIKYVDVGAADNIDSRWAQFSRFINYIGFEPDKRSQIFEPLTKYAKKKIIRNALWSSNKNIKINLTRKPQVSSSYIPNYEFINLFSDSKRFDIIDNIRLDAIKMDDIKMKNFDFIKLDIQGGELKVLEGANNKLKECFGIEVEVEFFSIYLNQPLFTDIDEFLKTKDFVFIDFVNITRWERDNSYSGLGQCTFGDALFLKSPETILGLKKLTPKILSRYLSILLIYNRYDLISVISKNIDNDLYQNFSFFFDKINYLRRKQKMSVKLNRYFNKILKLFIGNDYKTDIKY